MSTDYPRITRGLKSDKCGNKLPYLPNPDFRFCGRGDLRLGYAPMGKLLDPLRFTGPVGNLSVYRLRSTGQLIVRTRGGASRHTIRTAPAFEQVRRNNAEFSGRSIASKWFLRALYPLPATGNLPGVAGLLNRMFKPIQELDTHRTWGQRHIRLSENRSLLEGFSLNHTHPVESVLRSNLTFTLERAGAAARVHLPMLVTGINFFPAPHAYVSVLVTLGIMPDLVFQPQGYRPTSPAYDRMMPVLAATPWWPVARELAATTLEVELDMVAPDEAYSLVLGFGIRYGAWHPNGIREIRKAGHAKVLALG